MNKNYISITKFSEALNTTPSALYSVLYGNEKYKEYLKIHDGELYVDETLIIVLKSDEIGIENPVENEIENQPENEYINHLKNEIKDLKKQLENKEKIIDDLTTQLIGITTKSQEIAEKALDTTTQAHFIQAMSQKKKRKKIFGFLPFGGKKGRENENEAVI